MKYLLSVVIILVFYHFGFSQENSRGNTFDKNSNVYQSDEDAPASSKKMSRRQYKKSYRYAFFKKNEDLIDEFYARMDKNSKKYKKMERKMKKPQYSDPSYFGHKRRPKIHKVGKMKFCTECGIRH